MKKRILSALLAAAVTLAMIPATAFAATGSQGEITPAILHDTRHEDSDTTIQQEAIPDGELYETGTYSLELDETAESDVTTVKISVKGLKEHRNNAQPNALGYWVGYAIVPDASKNVTAMAYAMGSTAQEAAIDTDPTIEALEPSVDASGNSGVALYADASGGNEGITRPYFTVQWYTGSEGSYTAEGDPVTYKIDVSGVEKYVEPGPEFAAPTVKAAILEDHAASDPISQDQLYTSYEVTGGEPDADSVVSVAVTATGLKEHTNGQGTKGHWIGFALVAPEGASQLKYAFGADSSDVDTLTGPVSPDPAVTTGGESGVAFYTNVSDPAPKTWAKVQWVDDQGNDFGPAIIYKVDISGVKIAVEAEVLAAAPEVTPSLSETATDAEKALASDAAAAIAGDSADPVVSADVLHNAVQDVSDEVQEKLPESADAAESALTDVGIDISQSTVTTVVQTYLDIRITDATAPDATDPNDATAKTLTLDITPMYRIVVTTADVDDPDNIILYDETAADNTGANAVIYGQTGTLTVTESVEMKITLPTGFASNGDFFVEHQKDKTYIYQGNVAADVLTFTNPHGFSTFFLTPANNAAASTEAGGTTTYHATLADAVAAVGDGETITLLKPVTADTTVTVPEGVTSFTIKPDDSLSTDEDKDLSKVTVQADGYTVSAGTPDETTGAVTYTLDLAAPVFKIGTEVLGDAKTVTGSASVTIEAAAGAKIYYTTDGSDPSAASTEYTGAISITKTTTLKAIAQNGSDTSAVAEVKITVNPKSTGGSSGGGGGGSSQNSGTKNQVGTERAANGSITVSPSNASKGQTVTITPNPATGYEVGSITVTDANGKEISVTKTSSGTYTFTMPDSKVTVTPVFVEKTDSGENPSVTLPFTDVAPSDWFNAAVTYAYANGLMSGTGSTTFSPNALTTRGMIVTVLHHVEGSPTPTASAGFTDVAAGSYYENAVNWAASTNVVAGYGNSKFGPEDPITREQMAVILMNYAKLKGYDTTAKGSITNFTDGSSASAYAVEALNWAYGAGLISGKGNGILDPQGYATRAEIASILMNFCQANSIFPAQ